VKLVCDCGNEMEFVVDDPHEEIDEDIGYFVKKDIKKFDFWSEHDEAGLGCRKCGFGIWYFT